jgi:NTE family protein
MPFDVMPVRSALDKTRVPRIGLALSGGGNRAAAFAVGVVTALLDAGLLPQVRVITSSSGGSLVTRRWPVAG